MDRVDSITAHSNYGVAYIYQKLFLVKNSFLKNPTLREIGKCAIGGFYTLSRSMAEICTKTLCPMKTVIIKIKELENIVS